MWWRVLLGGIGVGFLTGFLGVGGGFLIVPALVLLLGMDMRDVVGSSLVVIAINSAAGLSGHLSEAALNWLLIGMLLSGGVPGLLLGSQLAKRLPAARLCQGFAVFVVVLAATLLAINIPLVMAREPLHEAPAIVARHAAAARQSRHDAQPRAGQGGVAPRLG